MKSWKTTATGILTVVAGLVAGGIAILGGHTDIASLGPAIANITAGFGLIFAKDNTAPSS